MEIVQKRIEYKSRKTMFEIWPVGDVHLGNIGCDVKKLKETVDEIKGNPNAYVILTGDICESITMADKRFDPRSIDKHYHITDLSHLIRRQLEDAVNMLSPLKGKILGVLSGNHEEKIRLTSYFDISLELARELSAPYLGYDGFIRLNFIRTGESKKIPSTTKFTFYVHHGHGGGRRSGSKINVLEDAAHIFDCDCVIMGHGHKKIICPPILRLGLDRAGNLKQKKQFAIMAGSFLKGYMPDATTYVEKALYSPSDLGTIKIVLRPGAESEEKSMEFIL